MTCKDSNTQPPIESSQSRKYRDKEIAPDSGEPEWWSNEDGDKEYQAHCDDILTDKKPF